MLENLKMKIISKLYFDYAYAEENATPPCHQNYKVCEMMMYARQ